MNLYLSSGFELRVSHFLGRFSATWATPSSLFYFSYFSDRVPSPPSLDGDPPTYNLPGSWDDR
jgi:hypothetical protein